MHSSLLQIYYIFQISFKSKIIISDNLQYELPIFKLVMLKKAKKVKISGPEIEAESADCIQAMNSR